MFVTTSLREGFGYTPIEAAIYGCPVVCSTSEALPETTRNLLFYYEPATDEWALAKKIFEVTEKMPSKYNISKISKEFRELYTADYQNKKIIKLLYQ